ncbi:DUF5610 domain-containing protein [Alteromonas sp. ASW11-36]|uniref:DUF5610 domain-containing protein n=1 Tax=Alteromonas arenosi TaxID=3055817 RepID=A0ABT7SZ28_9ALTE|nr:DUF5610 domain-containing protein [Alteromonas sp. ASW11-36]MDM7861421.1 DUF5610 domain-containing protein [Alteromonas sp. ASW11-36]
MNFGEIKAFHNEQPQQPKPSAALNKQLQAEGLKQAASFQANQAASVSSASVSVISSQTTVGLKIYSGSMQQNVAVNGERAKQATEFDTDKPATLFDFEKVAENVMRFVGGVIKGAANSGADQEQLNSLFEQAREGVAKGIKLAERDIGGLMNDEIAEGISNSRSLLDQQIGELENQLLGKPILDALTAEVAAVQSTSEQSGELLIRTRDGDEVRLTFNDLQQVSVTSQSVQTPQPLAADQQGGNESADTPTTTFAQSLNARTLQLSGYSVSVTGDIDDGELAAITDLISNANDLADTFYRGDMEAAFEQALKLGYNDEELVGFALQLNRLEQTEAVKAYGYVKNYSDTDEEANEQTKTVKPLAQYLERMLAVLEQSRQTLESNEDYNKIINGIVNEMTDVQVPDLVQAINRFHTFNQKLLDGLPKTEAE